jgi:hypothetical protein
MVKAPRQKAAISRNPTNKYAVVLSPCSPMAGPVRSARLRFVAVGRGRHGVLERRFRSTYGRMPLHSWRTEGHTRKEERTDVRPPLTYTLGCIIVRRWLAVFKTSSN